jgi:hypothetical protein
MPGEFYIEGKQQKVSLKDLSAAIAELEAKLDSVVVYRGETTAYGAIDGSTLICSDLMTRPNFDGNLVVILSGDYTGQARVISGSTVVGTVTPESAFGGQIVAGVKFAVLSFRSSGALALTMTTPSNSVVANWNSGVATSGNPGADLVSVGANDTNNKLHSLLANISALSNGATVRVRLFMQVNGVESQVYNQTFIKGTDPNGLWIVNGTVGIHEVLRVELHSDNAADDGRGVDYDYMLEAI